MAVAEPVQEEIRNGLFQISLPVPEGGKKLSLYNSTKHLQFNVSYEFKEPQLTALGSTVCEGSKYGIIVYPGETKEFVQGRHRGCKRGLSFGPPDAEFLAKQAASVNEEADAEKRAVQALVKANPKADGRYTADWIAQLCEAHDVPFVDLTFPPGPACIARPFEVAAGAPCPPYAWQRPDKYCDADKPPCLFVGDIEPNDIDQGRLGNCYFLCALACISEFPDLVKLCFQAPQNSAVGVYRVRLCKNGWWSVVTVDDLVPTERGVPVFAKNREEPNELWVSVLEKAYAKLHGSYTAIKSGDPAMALADMLGGPYVRFKDHPDWTSPSTFFQRLREWDDDDHVMTLSTPGADTTNYGVGGGPVSAADAASLAETYKKVGLVTGHAFSLIRVKEYNGMKLCMIRNPWGNGMEWNGAWSDNDPAWTPEMKRALDFTSGDDGTFWMSWDDVHKWFDGGAVCFVFPQYYRLRVAANFEKGIPDLVLEVTVSGDTSVKAWVGAHQRDNRGLVPGDADGKYVGMLTAVLTGPETGSASKRSTVVAASNGGNFKIARDAITHVELEPRPKPYYFLVQSYAEDDKSFVLSAFFESIKNVSVQFVSYREGTAKKANPPALFDVSTCTQRVAAKYQILAPATNGAFLERQGDSADFNVTPADLRPPTPLFVSSTSTAAGPTHSATAATGRQPDAALKTTATTSHPSSVVPTNTGPAKGSVVGGAASPAAQRIAQKKAAGPASPPPPTKLSVTVLSGRNLASRDANGFSDPYVTITAENSAGAALPDQSEVSTRYINKTLNPTWGEQFLFVVPHNGCLRFHCWDRDLIGRDDMGEVVVPIAELGLVLGGPAKLDHFPLKGKNVTGDLQLLFTILE